MAAFPDDCIQNLVTPWWEQLKKHPVERGHLLWAWVPHFTQTPYTLIPESRDGPTEHRRVLLRIESLKPGRPPDRPDPPVAALPLRDGEVYTVFRGKMRPVLVLGTKASAPPRPEGAPKSQTAPMFVVAPYHGAERTEKRAGYPDDLLRRIRHCEYPQFIWDILPVKGASSSILRLDHMQPLGDHNDSYVPTGFGLSKNAIAVLDEWIEWLMTGVIPSSETDLLAMVRMELMKLG